MTHFEITEEYLGELTMNNLYDLAKERLIKNARKLKKEELIQKIMEYEQGTYIRLPEESDSEEEKPEVDDTSESEAVVVIEERAEERVRPPEARRAPTYTPPQQQQQQPGLENTTFQKGVLDIHSDGNYGFIRQKDFGFGTQDIYVSASQIKKFALRMGDEISGYVRPPREQEKYSSMVKIEGVNGVKPETARQRKTFESLVPVYPNQRLFLEWEPNEISTRIVDLFSPIGKGQRGLIVAQPKAGKTMMLKRIANSVAKNHPEVELLALLVDERPEEVTDFQRNVDGKVVSSTFDEKPDNHIQVAELTLEYAKRRVESGKDVIILLDSLTRLARAYNLVCPPSGKTLSGGLDPNSLFKPKRFLGAARNIENGGSLTIIVTVLVETGSRLDDIIFEEFKGTANSELHLLRNLADRRIFPAVDLMRSGTRHEELLYHPDEMDSVLKLRRAISMMDDEERMNQILRQLQRTKTNVELLYEIQRKTASFDS